MSAENATRSAKKSVRSDRNEEAAPENRSGVDAKIQASQRIAPKTTKSTQGVAVMNLKKGQCITDAHIYQEDELQNPSRYRKKIPALGALPNGEEGREQISL